jgi:hypothetical protein
VCDRVKAAFWVACPPAPPAATHSPPPAAHRSVGGADSVAVWGRDLLAWLLQSVGGMSGLRTEASSSVYTNSPLALVFFGWVGGWVRGVGGWVAGGAGMPICCHCFGQMSFEGYDLHSHESLVSRIHRNGWETVELWLFLPGWQYHVGGQQAPMLAAGCLA